jgi:hypothetical protein
MKNGISTSFFGDDTHEYQIHGPIGKGLGIKPSGTHIAFSAGTGLLVFVDLVAYLIKKNLGLLSAKEAARLDDSFKLVLYVSFFSSELTIALELLEGLQTINTKLGKNNFELNVRLGSVTNEKWNELFLDKCLEKYSRENI